MAEPQPYKKPAVAAMFDNIAHRYDFLNHFLSFGIDRFWRRRTIEAVRGAYVNPRILDVAAGTADLSVEALKLSPVHITGIDISDAMLERGRKKLAAKGLSGKIDLRSGDSENIQFGDNCFDIAMVAFGVRNCSDPLRGMTEMTRVVRTGGTVLVLEFSKPAYFPLKQLYNLYFLNILPVIGRLFSKNKSAYRYLPDSVMRFPDNEKFMDIMKASGLSSVTMKQLTGGIVTIYRGLKPKVQ